jgi:hypothetical protein
MFARKKGKGFAAKSPGPSSRLVSTPSTFEFTPYNKFLFELYELSEHRFIFKHLPPNISKTFRTLPR